MTCVAHCAAAASLLLLLASPLCSEPADGSVNEFGRWRTARPGDFVPINAPRFGDASGADLGGDAEIIGLVIDGEARAYPLRLMTYHHVANDVVAGRSVAVTYCVMANTAVVFGREPGSTYEAGALFGGVLALREVDSSACFAQIARVPLPGGESAPANLPIAAQPVLTTWERWKRRHPTTRLLQPEPGYELRYEAYDRRSKGFVANPLMNSTIVHHDDRLPPGEEVFGVADGPYAAAISLADLRRDRRRALPLGDTTVTVTWDEELETAVAPADFRGFAMRSYWYAWSQFHPGGELH